MLDHDYSEGAWLVGISLQPPSTPTPVYARLHVDPQKSAALDKRTGSSAPGKQEPLDVAISTGVKGREAELAVAPRWGHEARTELPTGALQDDGSTYLDASGTLHARLEIQFHKPTSDNDCIIC